MTGGFQVLMDDLTALAETFSRQAGEFKAIIPPSGPPCPDGGDAAINQAMLAIVEMTGLLHLQFAGELDNHAMKLRQAHAAYAAAEDDILRAVHGIMAQ
ncbi:MAG TPA: DUF6317 family protein [Chloroflexota bacterium]